MSMDKRTKFKISRELDKSDRLIGVVKKRQSVLEDLQDKIIALYAKGMTTRDIQEMVEDIYGIELSPSLISRLTERIIPRLEEWQSRALSGVYTIIWLDCIFYRVREENKVINKAVYVVIGLGVDGKKEILGFWISQKESSSFWLGVLKDLKGVYGASTLEGAISSMQRFEEKWISKYPHVIKSWRANWERLMTYFRYPVEIRKLMYTTNLIESVNSKFRKVTDSRRLFPSDESVLKALFMAALEIERKWTKPIKDWSLIYSQLVILFGDRLDGK